MVLSLELRKEVVLFAHRKDESLSFIGGQVFFRWVFLC